MPSFGYEKTQSRRGVARANRCTQSNEDRVELPGAEVPENSAKHLLELIRREEQQTPRIEDNYAGEEPERDFRDF